MKQCEICGSTWQVHIHHIISRGHLGKRALIEVNEINLCFKHHYEVHQIGRGTFAKKYNLQERFKKAEEALCKISLTN